MSSLSSLRMELRPDGVAIIWIDVIGESQNTLNERFAREMEALQKEIEANGAKALVIASAKETSFIAGADIRMIQTLGSGKVAESRSQEMQHHLEEIENGPLTVVAAIHGVCLGGGLELALACHGRVASDDRVTKLGLPEVQLGLLPGGGGTQRLPALIGVADALDLMLTGKQIPANKARKLGLVDLVVPRSILIPAAVERALALAAQRKKRPSISQRLNALADELTDPRILKEMALAKNPAGRKVVFDRAEETVRSKAADFYPAPFAILEVVKTGLAQGRKAGLLLESKRFGELVESEVSKQLIGIFFATTALKKDKGTDVEGIEPRTVKKIGVLGAGLMGQGISFVSLDKAGVEVAMRDLNREVVGKGLSAIAALVQEQGQKRRLSESERERAMARVRGTTDYSGFSACDLVIEAVFEDLGVKQRVLAEVEAATRADTIFASNTSSIPITKIAEDAARPEMVVGMHYFSPVEKMPLLEVIRTKKTRHDVVATAVELGKRQGKTVIVVNDGVGFYTTRILGPYMNEASWMLADGVPVEDIDRAAKQAGFPVGPITLLDEVGIDTAEKIGRIMFEAYGKRLSPPAGLDKLVKDGRTGRKGGKGFYTYGGPKKTVDTSVYRLLGVEPRSPGSSNLNDLADRLLAQMVSEAILCLEEGILRGPRDGDIGAIFGLGFPPFLGGPFHYADKLGATELMKRIEGWASRYGERFHLPERLLELAKTAGRFHVS